MTNPTALPVSKLWGNAIPHVVTRALAAFQRSFVDGNSRYDQWLQGDNKALTR